jgi:isoquinoline 1-oxidoreductase
MADTASVPYDAGTFGSMSTPVMSPQLRRAAAAARDHLIALAAEEWQTDRKTLRVENGAVVGHGGKSARFGQLTKGRKLLDSIPDEIPTKPAREWSVAGQNVAKLNGRAFVTGKHQYTTDIRVEDAAVGKVLRPAVTGARLTALDSSGAEAMKGVSVVRDGEFAGVVAPDDRTAAAAIRGLKPAWKIPGQVSDKELYEHLKKTAKAPRSSDASGNVEQALTAAGTKLSATYTIAYIAHAPLEPRAAVAKWDGDRLTVWTGTQRPFGVRDELARVFSLAPAQVRVIVPDTGSAYGGKHSGEAAVEAARLARGAGRPVKLVWTREEEFTHAYFRPAGVIEVEVAAASDGVLSAWRFRNYNSGASAIRTPYEVANRQIDFCECQSPLRQGSYRALAATANTFARESAMDELAHLLGVDALEFRLRNLKDARVRRVLERAAKQFGWTKPERGRGIGLACGTEKGSYVASCAEIAMENGAVKVRRIVTAYDCGPSVNPDHLNSQVEGAIVMGLGGALFESIGFADGRIRNPRFSTYRVPRFSDVPVLETILIDDKDLRPAGAGETPIIGVAPAIANAIFNASGRRIRSMPLNA